MKVDVKVSHILDRLIFIPREKENTGAVKAALIEPNSNLRFNQSSEGIWIDAKDTANINITNLRLDLNWSELARKFVQNRKYTHEHLYNVIKEIKQIKEGGKAKAKTYLKGINGLQILDSHQWVNVACMTLPNSIGLCVFDEQGAGKTVTLIYAFDVLVERDEVDFALIIAPKSMVSEWPVDFEKFMSKRYKVLELTGSQEGKRKKVSGKVDVIVTNFETVVTMEQELQALLRGYGSRSMIVVDESFFAKNKDAKRTQAIRRLREFCGRAFVLCGTPAPNAPIDLVQQFNIVDFGATFANISIPKNNEEAAELIHGLIEEKGPFVRHLKSDVLPQLLNKKFSKVVIEMQPKQLKLYRDIAENLIADLKDVDDYAFEKNKISFLARRSSLLQICSNPTSISSSYDETPAKLLALDNLLEDLIIKRNEKVILWSFYTVSLSIMFKRYKKYNPVRYDGSVTDTVSRRDAVRLFRNDNNTMLFIGNPAAAGAGLNLQSARYAIYESMSNQAAHYLQSLDRIHRRGQTKQVEYIILLCKGTIEVAEYTRLVQKEKSSQKILGDTILVPFTRDIMLAELVL